MRSGSPARPSAPNYTVPALVMGLVNLLWIFFALWAAWGLPAVIAAGYLLYVAIDWLARRPRSRRQA